MQDQNNPSRQLAEIGQRPAREASLPAVTPGFGSLQSFELMQRAAKMLAHSTLVPVAYRATKEIKEYGKVIGFEDNPSALPNCVVALNMAQRMGADPLMVMQNLYIVEGRPSWSSQFIIAAINSCGRYSPLRFELSELGEPRNIEYTATEWVKNGGKSEKRETRKTITIRPRTCVAWAIELASGDRLESPVVSMDMAIAEGWIQKNGSKWQTMPDVMLRYRTAAFFGKLYAPELLMGLQTAEEAHDIIDVERGPDGKYGMATTLGELRDTGASEANEQAATPEPEDTITLSDAIDHTHGMAGTEIGKPGVEGQRLKSSPGQAGTDAEPDANAGMDPLPESQPARAKSAALTPEASEQYDRLMAQLNRASNLNQLADVYELVGEVANTELRAALTTLYKQRYAEMTPKAEQQDAAAAGPAKRTRRASGAAPE